jgi:N6-adenosine-specific RNA methylase IME4
MSNQNSTLWQSDNKDVFLIDIPRSISYAQGTSEHPCRQLLLSTKPLEEPYPTNEPKSAAARAKLVNNTVEAGLHAEYALLLSDALAKAKSAYNGPWCVSRHFVEVPATKGKKRKLSPEGGDESENATNDMRLGEEPLRSLPNDIIRRLSEVSIARIHGIDLEKTSQADGTLHVSELQREGTAQTWLTVSHPRDPTASFNFAIPPDSSFVLGSCWDPTTLHRYIRAQAQELDVPKTFNAVVLDPPWPNSSVKRTHKTANSTYSTAATLQQIYELIIGMDLDMLMADDCVVAMWITNKPAVRDLVLGEGGIFECLGVELVEEWIWLKTTLHGEPITPIDSVWRKPYEIQLVGRKRRNYLMSAEGSSAKDGGVKRRVLMSVPDLHSRKPCLKELIETLLLDANHYRALEVFARHLVTGWWSWGDECLKFNWEGNWRPDGLSEEAEVSVNEKIILADS